MAGTRLREVTLRAKSRAQQWMLRFVAALVLVLAYVVVLRFGFGVDYWKFFQPVQHRVLLAALVLFGCFAYETRWDGIVRKKPTKPKMPVAEASEKVGPTIVAKPTENRAQEVKVTEPISVSRVKAVVGKTVDHNAAEDGRKDVEPLDLEVEEEDFELGKAEYIKARKITHQKIPDFISDREYLTLVGRAALHGYAPAMVKLGEYAMRRGTLVEAYYWMWMARRHGMHGLKKVMRDIRIAWAMNNFGAEDANVHKLFGHRAGSIGRALLHIDVGRNAFAARKFLSKNYPELLA